MLLTLLAVPLVLAIQILPLAVLSEAFLKSQRCLPLRPVSYRHTQIHEAVEFCGSVLADLTLHRGLQLALKEVDHDRLIFLEMNLPSLHCRMLISHLVISLRI